MALISGREGSPVGHRATWLVAGVARFGGHRLAATRRGTHGSGGSRKDRLARAAASAFARRHPKAVSHWISATASASRVPVPGAFSHLVELKGAGEPATVLHDARASLCPPGAGGVLVAVDDAHLLHNLSATLIHLLAVTASARLILTARSGEPMPDAVTSLWKDSLIARLDIGPFDRTQSTRLIETVLGGPLETASANRVYMMSRGNPAELATPLEGAVHAGSLREVDGVWQLRGEIALTPQLSYFISRHLSSLSTPVQGVLEYLSIEEPLTVSDLSAVAGRDAVEEAEAAVLTHRHRRRRRAGGAPRPSSRHRRPARVDGPTGRSSPADEVGRAALGRRCRARQRSTQVGRARRRQRQTPPKCPTSSPRRGKRCAAGRSRARGAACQGRVGEVIGSARPACLWRIPCPGKAAAGKPMMPCAGSTSTSCPNGT